MNETDIEQKVLLIGGGGHAKVIIDAMRCGRYGIAGIIERSQDKIGMIICGIPVIGTDKDLPRFLKQGIKKAVIAIGHMGDGSVRHQMAQELQDMGFRLPVITHPKAIISPFARIGDGTVVFAGAVINAGARIGENCIINTASVVEHDVILGAGAHLAPRAVLAGGVNVGEDTMLGMGSCVLQKKTIGKRCIIGAGSVVIHDVCDDEIVVGVPAVCIKRRR